MPIEVESEYLPKELLQFGRVGEVDTWHGENLQCVLVKANVNTGSYAEYFKIR